MSSISWNYRGLGNLRAIREVSKLIRTHRPQILFLMKTKKRATRMDWLRTVRRFDNCLTVNCVGMADGLAFLWMNEVNLHITSFSSSHIDSIISDDDGSLL